MRVYEFTAPYFEIDPAALFLGFANNDTGQYFWMQRGEESPDEAAPDVGDVYIERDDQGWGAYGGITRVALRRDSLTVELTADVAEQVGGYDAIRVMFSLTGAEFAQVREQLRRVMRAYESVVELSA
jgi:hypothetical protein